jgi:hypothetical protein
MGYETLVCCAAVAVPLFARLHVHLPAVLRACMVTALEALLFKVTASHQRGAGCWLSSETYLSANLTSHFARRENGVAAADAAHAAAAVAFDEEVLPLWQTLLIMRPAGNTCQDAGAFQTFVRDKTGASLNTMKGRTAAAAAAPSLRVCAHTACAAREAHTAQFKLCSACKTVCYCSKAHQAEDWPAHKAACKAARKAAAAAEKAAAGLD